ncbi:MAG TPA: glutaminyl-peptide cyclotransferase [Bacteroidales bacterium]|jgi:glutamine cyclotransferase|nr:glutaminyl-peptide cyclotransferase [Bacteroidales bacterium]HQG77674.1 glutaminyl-peptide cyclotransferase [Bacteroidales bacterium]
MARAAFRYVFILIILPLLLFVYCSGRTGGARENGKKTTSRSAVSPSLRFIRMQNPVENSEFHIGEQFEITLGSENKNQVPDSVRFFYDGHIVGQLYAEPWVLSIPSAAVSATGRKPVKVTAYKNDKVQTVTRFVIILSDIVPETKSFRIVNTYPHDREAFTQGLFFDGSVLYEGTGQEAGSSLREVDLETGKVIRQHNLEPSLFGEGITLYKDRIYQVTWTSKIGFVYDRATFRLLNRFYYQTQGWGLTTMNGMIVMSDGSNNLYFHEPEMFSFVSGIEVYDNEKKVDQLNELEYINGEIWANIWQTDLIARIDPSTGKVNSYVDLESIYPEWQRRQDNSDVLNGIAYDAQNKRIFVTGKRWPKLYEIRVSE